ncbi:hypothetical protein ACHAXR_010322 [Thalassiosira sp. AJA248-18]
MTQATLKNHSFASKFSRYGCIGSLLSIALLAAICNVCGHRNNGIMMDMMLMPDSSITSKQTKGNRFLLENDGGPSNVDKVDLNQSDEKGMACGDIFLYVKSQPITEESNPMHNNITSNSTKRSNDDYNRRLCHYAQTCDGDFPSRKFLPLILCNGIDPQFYNNSGEKTNDNNQYYYYCLETIFIYIILPPALLLYLLLLFRLLATTADSYFSPALESFSFELGLPPRFAGATLLALGNGSPDLGSTVNSILLWNEASANKAVASYGAGGTITQQGWTMSLGSLTGGGMFVGTIVCGLLVQYCSGIPCRWAFLRDVSMYALSICVVWYTLESGSVTTRDVQLFIGMYLTYVAIIACADLYHRKVTLHRLHEEGKKRRKSLQESARRLSQLSQNGARADTHDGETTPLMENPNTYGGERFEQLKGEAGAMTQGEEVDILRDAENADIPTLESSSSGNNISTSSGNHIPRHPRLSVTDRFAMLMSNYDPASVRFDKYDLASSGTSSGSVDSSEWEAITTVIHKIHPGVHPSLRNVGPLARVSERTTGSSDIAGEDEFRTWSRGLFIDAYDELIFRYHRYLRSCFQSENSLIEKMGLFFELPFVAIRTVTIPVPCEEHYCRPILALSVALSPYWVVSYISFIAIPAAAYCFISLIIALSILRYADEDKLPLLVSIPISLYGFFIAATWIDTIADNLVGLLQFFGTISRIPSTILGLTVLAWGNSMGDLSANLAMARKGMPDMATTGCFAGPSFNLLVGTGFGFLYLQYELHTTSISPDSILQK